MAKRRFSRNTDRRIRNVVYAGRDNARRGYGYVRSAFRGRYVNRGGFGMGINAQYLIGAAASFMPIPINNPNIGKAITAIAVLPIRLPYGIKMACQGYILGKLVQSFTGNPLIQQAPTTDSNVLII